MVNTKRTTIKLPEGVDRRLRFEAERRHMTMSDLTREAIEAHLGMGPKRQLWGGEVAGSGHHDTSERVEELLYGGLK